MIADIEALRLSAKKSSMDAVMSLAGMFLPIPYATRTATPTIQTRKHFAETLINKNNCFLSRIEEADTFPP